METPEPDYSPRVTAEAVRCTTDYLRLLHARRFLDGVAKKCGSTWRYPRSGVLNLGLALGMSRGGLGLEAAFAAIANPTPAMIAALAGHGDSLLVFWPRRNNGTGTLNMTVKVVVDAPAIVRDVAARLDIAAEAERRRPRGRVAFEPAPTSANA